MVVPKSASDEIEETKRQFLIFVTSEYFLTGFFWILLVTGSLVVVNKSSPLFFSLFILMLSNGIWEILTGWYADKFRRRVSIAAGFFFCFLGFCLMAVASYFGTDSSDNFRFIIWSAGIAVWSLGPALLSGAEEAWLVDRCNFLSGEPPEDLASQFKLSGTRGVIAKALGAALALAILLSSGVLEASAELTKLQKFSVALCGGIAALSSLAVLFYAANIKEEYWEHPKYQTTESLPAFLWKGAAELVSAPYCWFTMAYSGIMILTYLLSSTLWPYLIALQERTSGVALQEKTLAWELSVWVVVIVLVELAAGGVSAEFSRLIDSLERVRIQLPLSATMYLWPWLLLPLAIVTSVVPERRFLYVVIAATFSFRVAYPSVFGSLNALGQRLIVSDERRAVLVSMSSASAAFLSALAFLSVFLSCDTKEIPQRIEIPQCIELLWWFVVPICFVLLSVGGFLATRPSTEAS